jgi:2-(1,2-epoxy-1,2-dihydrophenyl)acetyl-CoA isomerase
MSDLSCSTSDGVAVIEITRGPHNYFDMALIAGIADVLDSLAADGSTRAAVLCSEGKHFCAGADFRSRPAAGSPGAPAFGDRHLYDEAIRLFEQPLPLVAAVQGAAIGGGLGLAMACDFRVACPEAWFTANFAKLGFHHGFALTATLPAAVGQQAALDLLYTGRKVGGEEAKALGLADRLVPADQLRAEAHAVASEIAASAPLAVRSIRETMRRPIIEAAKLAVQRERAEQDRLQKTADFKEGIAATAERRTPRFTGA